MKRSTRLLALAVSVLSLATRVASADPEAPRGPKSREVARALAITGTLASAAVIAIGATRDSRAGKDLLVGGAVSLLVTPSIGAWYAEQPLTIGMAVRAIPVGLTLYVTAVADVEAFCIKWTSDTKCPSPKPGVLSKPGLVVLGGLLYAAGIAIDIIDAPSVADRYNMQLSLRLAPGFAPTPSGTVPTLGLSGTF